MSFELASIIAVTLVAMAILIAVYLTDKDEDD